MKELDDELHTELQKLSELGDSKVEVEDYSNAIKAYEKALDLIPEPKNEWEATTWVLVAIGDAHFLENSFQEGLENFQKAMTCPGAIGNPFIHMRLGQCQFELGNLDRAADELTRAYAIEGEDIFSDDDPKYLEFLKTRIVIAEPKKKPWWKF